MASPGGRPDRIVVNDIRLPIRRGGGIVEWFAGSPLQPFLERLSDDERGSFLDRYRKELQRAYPLRSDGKVLFAYPRLFIVAIAKLIDVGGSEDELSADERKRAGEQWTQDMLGHARSKMAADRDSGN